jgi:hypothetical protein
MTVANTNSKAFPAPGQPSQPKNPSAALEIFRSHRSSIEAAASVAFDINGVDEGDFGGKPIVTV